MGGRCAITAINVGCHLDCNCLMFLNESKDAMKKIILKRFYFQYLMCDF